MAPNASLTITATGAVGALTWQIIRDSTFDPNSYQGDSLNPAAGSTALYQAGPEVGETVIQVIDADGQDAFLTILVTTATADAGPSDAGPTLDAATNGRLG